MLRPPGIFESRMIPPGTSSAVSRPQRQSGMIPPGISSSLVNLVTARRQAECLNVVSRGEGSFECGM